MDCSCWNFWSSMLQYSRLQGPMFSSFFVSHSLLVFTIVSFFSLSLSLSLSFQMVALKQWQGKVQTLLPPRVVPSNRMPAISWVFVGVKVTVRTLIHWQGNGKSTVTVVAGITCEGNTCRRQKKVTEWHSVQCKRLLKWLWTYTQMKEKERGRKELALEPDLNCFS